METLESLESKRRQAYEEYIRLSEEIERLKDSETELIKNEMNEKYAGKYFKDTATSCIIDIMYVRGFETPDECVCDRICKTEYDEQRVNVHFYKCDTFVFRPEDMKEITQTEYLNLLKEILKSAQELENTQYEY